MTLNIRIKSANLAHDTELIGQMVAHAITQDVYVVALTKDGREIKRTGIQKGKLPEWPHQIFMCSEELGGLQFRLYDKERMKLDDFIGRAKWSFQSVTKRPYEGLKVAVPLEYQGKNAGKLNLEVYYDEGRVYIGPNQSSPYFDGKPKQLERSNSMQQLGFSNYTNNSGQMLPPPMNTNPMPQLPQLPMGQSNVSNASSAHFSNSQFSNRNPQLPPKPPRPPAQLPMNPMAESHVLPVEHQANKTTHLNELMNQQQRQQQPPRQQTSLQHSNAQSLGLGPSASQVGALNPHGASQASQASQQQPPNIPPGTKPHPALNFLYSSVASKVTEADRIHLEKVEHSSFNLFTILDGWSPFTSEFSIIPSKLRNN